MAKRHDNDASAQHGTSTVGQHATPSDSSLHRADAQHASSTTAQHGPGIAWEMSDDDAPRGDAYLDAPIPYRLSHEAGVDLDRLDPRGSVP